MNTVVCPNGHEIDQEKTKDILFKKSRAFYYYGIIPVPVVCSECKTAIVVKEKYEILRSALKKVDDGTKIESLSKEEQTSLDEYFLDRDLKGNVE